MRAYLSKTESCFYMTLISNGVNTEEQLQIYTLMLDLLRSCSALSFQNTICYKLQIYYQKITRFLRIQHLNPRSKRACYFFLNSKTVSKCRLIAMGWIHTIGQIQSIWIYVYVWCLVYSGGYIKGFKAHERL